MIFTVIHFSLKILKDIPKHCLKKILTINEESVKIIWSAKKMKSGELDDYIRRYNSFYKLLLTGDENKPAITLTTRIAEIDTPKGRAITKEWLYGINTMIYERYIFLRKVAIELHNLHLDEFMKPLAKKFDNLAFLTIREYVDYNKHLLNILEPLSFILNSIQE